MREIPMKVGRSPGGTGHLPGVETVPEYA